LDGLRGLLPAATTTNLGLFGSAQSYESLLVHLDGHPLAELRALREAMLIQLRQVIPEMLSRVDQPSRGGRWAAYLAEREARLAEAARAALPAEQGVSSPGVRLVAFDPDGELRILAAALAQAGGVSEGHARAWVERQDGTELDRLFALAVGERSNRRHRPGRAFEATHYRFEVVCDYGAFRDLQRHRMLTIDWLPLTPDLGYEVPSDVDAAGLGVGYADAMERAGELYYRLAEHFSDQAVYVVPMGYRIRFVVDFNAREAMHLIELRSQPQGHPAYRAVAQAMLEQIETVAGHRRLAQAMTFADRQPSVELGRLAAERRSEARRQAGSTCG
jgi:thymidylate synthase ThyX